MGRRGRDADTHNSNLSEYTPGPGQFLDSVGASYARVGAPRCPAPRRSAPIDARNEQSPARSVESGPLGLSKAHISPRASSRVEVAVGGEWLKACREAEKQEQVGGGKRGAITGFSRASRRRMMRWLVQLDKRKLYPPLFIHLTYPGKDEAHWLRYARHHKRHLDTFCKWIERAFPESFTLWRLEPQERGAPHYHLLVFNVPWLPHDLLARKWWTVVGSGDPDHLAAGTKVEQCHSWRGAAYYVSKYLGKECGPELLSLATPQLWQHPGRWWGVRNRKNVPVELEVYGVDPNSSFWRLRRMMRGAAKARGYRLRPRSTVTVFVGCSTGRRMLAYCGAWLE